MMGVKKGRTETMWLIFLLALKFDDLRPNKNNDT